MATRGRTAGHRAGEAASYASALLTIVAIGVGIAIVVRSGATSGLDVTRLSVEQLRAIHPLLLAAELLKIASAVALAIAAHSARFRFAMPIWAAAPAFVAALLIALAGALGLGAVAALDGEGGMPDAARTVGLLGLALFPLTGLWAALLSHTADARRGHRLLGYALAILGISAVLLPPVGMLFGILSIAWWVGTARLFGSSD